jgi:hypothetical protein
VRHAGRGGILDEVTGLAGDRKIVVDMVDDQGRTGGRWSFGQILRVRRFSRYEEIMPDGLPTPSPHLPSMSRPGCTEMLGARGN